MSSKKPTPVKMIRVAPDVTDPTMRNPKGPAERVLYEETGEELDETVVKKTKEETTKDAKDTTSESLPMMYVIIFALIIVALVALIVWMLMKQGSDKKDETEMKRLIQPHQRNSMPPMHNPPNQPNQPNHNPQNQQQMTPQQQQYLQQQQQRAHQLQQQQLAAQQHMENMSKSLEGETEGEPAPKKAAKKKKSTDSKKKKSKPEKAPDDDLLPEETSEEAARKQAAYSKDNPHPSILRPNKPATNEVDDIMQQTQEMLKANDKPTQKSNSEMTDMDRALLDKIHENASLEEEEDD